MHAGIGKLGQSLRGLTRGRQARKGWIREQLGAGNLTMRHPAPTELTHVNINQVFHRILQPLTCLGAPRQHGLLHGTNTEDIPAPT